MEKERLTQKLSGPSSPLKFFATVIVVAIILGITTGLVLAKTGGKGNSTGTVSPAGSVSGPPKSASQDNQTFKDFAEGVIQPKPSPKPGAPDDYSEGTYLLVRQGAVPVALTSSVVDLSQYVGKKVKVFGETQKALKEGWLMDVGKVQVE